MRFLITLLLATLASLAHADQSDHKFIDVQHDSVRGVTCWILNGRSISCLPDSSLPQIGASQSEAKRPYPTRSAYQDGTLQSDSLPQTDEVFQL